MRDYQDLTDLPGHVYNEIMHFFEVYKDLENIKTDICKSTGAMLQIKLLQVAVRCMKANACNHELD